VPADWDVQADVVVVGFGAAGACAALEAAAAGRRVLVLDRFDGGGATALSGGVVYAGGGTPQQRAAGVGDSAEASWALSQYNSLLAATNKTLNATISANHLNYLPCSMTEPARWRRPSGRAP